MSEQEASVADVTADVEVSDGEFEEYFKSGGKDDEVEPEKEQEAKAESSPEPEKKEAQSQSKKDEIERNYKAAMREEREKRKATDQKLEQLNQAFNRVIDQTKWQQMQAMQAQQQREPSFEEDPLNSLNLRQSKLEQALSHQYQLEQRRQQEEHLINRQTQFINTYKAHAEDYAQKNPEFTEAYNFLNKHRLEEHLAAGYTRDAANQILNEEEMAIVANAFKEGVNPAERIFKIAQMRGFKQATKTNDQKINQLERGMNASKSLSSPGGKTDKGLTLEDVAAMNDEEFAKVDWKKLMKQG